MPKECLSAMSFAFRSEELVARYDIPTYERWLRNADMRPAYDVHRRVLQILQHGAPAKRWVLKSPVHLQHVPVIRDVYPDARFSATHRDPVSIIPSVSSLVAQMRSVHSDRVDVEGIGRYHVELYTKTLDRFVDQVDSGEIDPAVLTNSRHTDFLADSMAVTRGLYAHFGWEISAEAAKRMEQHLRDHAEGRAGGTYDLASFGLDADELRARFARYAERFGVASTSK